VATRILHWMVATKPTLVAFACRMQLHYILTFFSFCAQRPKKVGPCHLFLFSKINKFRHVCLYIRRGAWCDIHSFLVSGAIDHCVVASGEASDTNTSHTLFRGGKEGDAYIVGVVRVWMSNVRYK
jgi:hypothetical protein